MWLRLIILSVCLCLHASGAVLRCLSVNYPDVSNRVAQAARGDIILIPAGTANWTNGIYFTNGIVIRGAGMGQTVITDNVVKLPGLEGPFTFKTKTNDFYRLCHLSIIGGSPKVGDYTHGIIEMRWTNHMHRIDHCEFRNLIWTALNYGDNVCGVVDHCIFSLNHSSIEVWHQAWENETLRWGDRSWARPPDFGSTNAVYVEDCTMARSGVIQAATDGYAGARFAVRFCTLSNCWLDQHGTETSGRYRGTRMNEFYNNHFITPSASTFQAIDMRSGSGVIFSNVTSGVGSGAYSKILFLNAYRASVSINPYRGAYGANPWDTNSPTLYYTGTCTATNGTSIMIDSNATWGATNWYAYTLRNVTKDRCAWIKTNTMTSLTFDYEPSVGQASQALSFAIGDTYEIRFVVACMDQPGLGQGDLLAGDNVNPYNTTTGVPDWPHEATEGIYLWANTGQTTNIWFGDPSIVGNRDVFSGIAKPGYTPLVYPHPLVIDTVIISPVLTSVPPGGTRQFTGSSGSGIYPVFEVATNLSGASITTNGLYTAGPNPGNQDIVRIWDSMGNFADATVQVGTNQPPSITSFTASPNPITYGSSSTVSWTTTGATTVTFNGTSVTANSSTNVSPLVDTTYTLIASNSSGSATNTVTVTLIPSADFTATPASITHGTSSSLVWHTTNAAAITLDGTPVSAHGTNIVSPGSTTTYTLVSSNASGSTNSLQTVTVVGTPPRNLILRTRILISP